MYMYNNFSSKKTKKVISALLASALVVTSAPITADAATTKVLGVKKTFTVAGTKVTGLSKTEKKVVKVTIKNKKVTVKGLKAGKVSFKIGKETYNVNVGATKVTATAAATTLKVNDTTKVSITAKYGANDKLTIKTSKSSVVKIGKSSVTADKNGKASVTLRGLAAGTSEITVKSANTGKYAKVKITVKADETATAAPSSDAPATLAPATDAPVGPTVVPTSGGAVTTAPTSGGAVTAAPTAAPATNVTCGAITVNTNVSGASIKVVTGSTVVATASTEDKTTATTIPVANGVYSVIISKNGYTTVTKDIKVEGNTSVDVTLVQGYTETVSEIASSYVTITFTGVTETLADFVPVVYDNKGNKIAVIASDVPKGTSVSVSFQFATTYAATQEGIWVVDGNKYNFTEVAEINGVVTAATAGNQVGLKLALTKANIKNVKDELISEYVTDIVAANTKSPLKTYESVQAVIDATNTASTSIDEKAAVIKALKTASTQLAFYNVLEKNFARVNSDWATQYMSGVTSNARGFIIDGANDYVTADNAAAAPFNETASAADIKAQYTAVQSIIDSVNGKQIFNAFNAAGTVEAQNKVTTLIETWYIPDDTTTTPPQTNKATLKKNSQIKSAYLAIKEATNQAALYNALISFAKITDDTTLKESEINTNLKADYLTYKTENTANLDSTTGESKPYYISGESALTTAFGTDDTVRENIITKADDAALKAALVAIYGTSKTESGSGTEESPYAIATKFGGLTETSTKADVKAALQKVADVTSHKTGTSKFDMTSVLDSQLETYLTTFTKPGNVADKANADLHVAANRTSVGDLLDDIVAANNSVYLTTIIQSKDNKEVKNALVKLAIDNSDKEPAQAFINLSDAVRDEVVEIINSKKSGDTAGSYYYIGLDTEKLFRVETSATDLKTETVADAIKYQETAVGKFNELGDLASTTTTEVIAALNNFTTNAYVENSATAVAYSKLTNAQKLDVANYIKALKVDVTSAPTGVVVTTPTPLDFSSAKVANTAGAKVSTIAEANAYIAQAIASIN